MTVMVARGQEDEVVDYDDIGYRVVVENVSWRMMHFSVFQVIGVSEGVTFYTGFHTDHRNSTPYLSGLVRSDGSLESGVFPQFFPDAEAAREFGELMGRVIELGQERTAAWGH